MTKLALFAAAVLVVVSASASQATRVTSEHETKTAYCSAVILFGAERLYDYRAISYWDKERSQRNAIIAFMALSPQTPQKDVAKVIFKVAQKNGVLNQSIFKMENDFKWCNNYIKRRI